MRRRSAAAALAALLVTVGLAGCSSSRGTPLAGVGALPAPASAWPQAGYDARHSSATKAVGPQTGAVRWTAKLAGNLTPGPVLGADGSILQASNDGVLHALAPDTGRQRWFFNGVSAYGTDLSTSPAVLGDGTILWPGPDNTLFALSEQGRRLWSETFAAAVLSPAVGGAGRVYVADLGGHLSALTVAGATHHRAWTIDVKGPDYASPTIGPDGTIFTASNHDLVAVRDYGTKAGVRWRYKAKDLIEVSNGVSSTGVVTLGTNNDDEYGITSAGKIAWSYAKGDYTYASSVVRPDGTSYFGDNMGRVAYLDGSGHQLQRVQGNQAPVRSATWTQPAVDARGDVYFAVQSGQVYGFGRTGRQLFHLDAGSAVNSYPAIGADGTLYVATTGGTLFAIK